MTTVIDPGASDESVIFTKSGTAILNVALTAGFTMTVPAVAGRVIVNAIYSPNPPDPAPPPYPTFTISSDFQIGDEVWILPALQNTVFMQDEFGNNLLQSVGGGFIKVANGTGSPYSNWRIMSYFPDTLVLTI